MKTVKHVLRPERLRQVPEQLSWVDQALVQRHFIDRCDARAAALYLFLITVADAQGLSYYGASTLTERLHLSAEELGAARQRLMELNLIAFQAPLYQVLALTSCQTVPRPPSMLTSPRSRQTSTASVSLAQLLELERRHARL